MITITCNHCGKLIQEVVYEVTTKDASRYHQAPISVVQLHWECVPLYGRGK